NIVLKPVLHLRICGCPCVPDIEEPEYHQHWCIVSHHSKEEVRTFSDRVLQTPVQGWVMAIVMALLSGFAGVYTEVPSMVVSVSVYLHSIGKPQPQK
ncbi:hypothetical protein BHM03_00045915, partial [Ensete ventricosum]